MAMLPRTPATRGASRRLAACVVAAVTVVGCEPIPKGTIPGSTDHRHIEEKIEGYFRKGSAVGPNVTMKLKDVAPNPVGLLSATLELSNGSQTQKIPVVVSRDGRYLVQGVLTDLSVDPLKAINDKIRVDGLPMRGNPEASVTIVEYSDFQCPFCARAYSILEEQVLADYGSRVRLVFKNFPLGIHPWAEPAALASICARQQSPQAFWMLYDHLFRNQREITAENLPGKALAVVLEARGNEAAFRDCFEAKSGMAQLKAELQEAAAVGVRSTPTFFIDGRKLEGALPYEELKTAIDQALAARSSAARSGDPPRVPETPIRSDTAPGS